MPGGNLSGLPAHPRNQEEWQGALPLRRSDGVYRRIAFRSRRMELPGERPFILNHGMDVTEQHEGRGGAAPGHPPARADSRVGGRRHLRHRPRRPLTFINQAGARALGYTPEELTGRDVHEVIHHSHADGTPYSKATSPILQACAAANPSA
jgi:two-component system sensor histidine kinase VicK